MRTGAILALLIHSLAFGATWNGWNGATVGASTGNVSALDGKTIGTATGNLNSWNGLVSPSAAGGAVTFDAVGPGASGQTGTGASPLTITWNHVMSAAADGLLVVGCAVTVSSSDDSTSTLAVSFDSVAMTSQGRVQSGAAADHAGYVQLFTLLTTTHTGTKTVSATLTNPTAPYLECGSISFTGVNQTAPVVTAHTAAAQGTSISTTFSAAVTSSTGNAVVAVGCTGSSGITAVSQTQRWLNNYTNTGACGRAAQSTAAGASSVTMGYSSPSDWWALEAIDIAHD